MNLEPLKKLIHEHGLSKYQDNILATARPAIFLNLEQSEIQNGQSKIGGVPDLPLSIPWPKDPSYNKYLCFILQINLAELPAFPENPFPKKGMLYLFANESENSVEQLVFYNGSEPLQPANLPEEDLFITDWYENLVAHRLTFDLLPDVPRTLGNK